MSWTISLADFQEVHTPPGNLKRFQRLKYNRKVSETERKVKQRGSETRRFLVIANKSADLYEIGDQRLCKEGDELWRITAQVAIMSEMDYGDLTRELDQIAQSELRMYAGAGHVVADGDDPVAVIARLAPTVLSSQALGSTQIDIGDP